MSQPQLEPTPPSSNLRPLLIVMGILIVLGSLGCGFGLGGYTVAFPLILEELEGGGMTEEERAMFDNMGPMMWMGAAFYFLAGLAGAWLGIGSILCRRWAWKLILASGWLWIGMIVVYMISLGFMMPFIMEVMNQAMMAPGSSGSGGSPSPPMSSGMVGGIIVVVMLVYALMGALPGVVLLIVYNLRNVRLTCEYRDPKPRWTDKVPVPVLVFWLLLLFGTVMMLVLAPMYYQDIPGFEIQAPPVVRVAAVLLLGLLMGSACWKMGKLKVSGWWLAVAAMVIGFAASIYAFQQMDLIAMYREMGMAESELEEMERVLPGGGFTMWPSMVAMAVVVIGYLLWIRRYFGTGGAGDLPDDPDNPYRSPRTA